MKIVYFNRPSRSQKFLIAYLILVLIAAILIFLYLANEYVQVMATHRLVPIYEVRTNRQELSLTFDISWGHTSAPPILKVLRDNQIRATFFLSGPWIEVHPEIARQIKADGHEIASHGDRHINYSTLPKHQIIEEIMTAHKSIKQVTGVDASLIRAPNGDYNDLVIEAATDVGYKVIQWSVDSLDWKNPGVDYMVDRVLSLAQPGAIILMHASDSCKQTADALPRIIAGLRSKGFKFVTVSELLAASKSNKVRLRQGSPEEDRSSDDSQSRELEPVNGRRLLRNFLTTEGP
ncbi:MAG: polysaccharide deacetylase family sporulation protein PdaB [Syntrophothermus sp.]